MKNIFIAVLLTVLSFKTYAVNNIKLEGNSITTHNENGDINITPRGTGALRLNGPVGFGVKPDASAAFEIKSTTLGAICSPLMSEAERDAISNPARGLQIYNTDTDKINIFDGGAWTEIGGAGGANTALSNLVDPTAVNEDLNLDAAKTVRLKNDVYLMGRDSSDLNDIPLIKANAAESVTIGDDSSGAWIGLNSLSGFAQFWTNTNADGHLRIRGDQLSVETFGATGAHLELLGGTAGGSYINLWDTDAINSIGFKSPDVLTGSTLFILPDGDGTAGQCLQTDGAANLSWISPAYEGFASFEVSNLMNGTPSSWGADFPAIVIDGTSAEANSGSAAGVILNDPTGVNFLVIGTSDVNLTTPSSPIFISSGSNADGDSAKIKFSTGPSVNGASGDFEFAAGSAGTTPGSFIVNNINDFTVTAGGIATIGSDKLEVTSGIKPASKTADPCADTANYPEGTLFYNDTNDYYCFCDAATTAKQMQSPGTSCAF